MKKLLLALSLLTTCSTPSYAALNCAEQAFLAKAVMEHRQNGMDIATFYQILAKVDVKDEQQEQALNFMMIMATEIFSMPVYMTPENKKHAISEAANSAFLGCLQNVNR